jgi:hypothetical protein
MECLPSIYEGLGSSIIKKDKNVKVTLLRCMCFTLIILEMGSREPRSSQESHWLPEFFFLLFGVFVCLFETGFHYVAQSGLEVMILPSQLAKCWDYRCVAPFPANIAT